MALIGIDLGGTQLRVAVADDQGRIQTVIREATEANRGRDHVINRIVSAVGNALEEDGTPARRVAALGLAMPGPVDPEAGLVVSPANLPGFRNVPLNQILSRRLRIPSFLHHDAHLAALGEHRRGAARGFSELIYVTVSTGIGAGLILRNELYPGAHGVAGEVGHIVVQRGGPLCRCGNYGCVEAISSGTGISKAAATLAPENPDSTLHAIAEPTAADVVRAARAGDSLAIQILETAGAYLGIAIGTLVNLFNPQVIVLGGSVTKAGALLLAPMRKSMIESSWAAARQGLKIVRPALGDDVGLIGAVEFARLRARKTRAR
jgi:glucokinase